MLLRKKSKMFSLRTGLGIFAFNSEVARFTFPYRSRIFAQLFLSYLGHTSGASLKLASSFRSSLWVGYIVRMCFIAR